MIRNEVYSNIATVTHRLAVGCLLLFALVGSLSLLLDNLAI